MVMTLTLLCQKIWVKKEWPYEWAQYLIIPIPKKGDPWVSCKKVQQL